MQHHWEVINTIFFILDFDNGSKVSQNIIHLKQIQMLDYDIMKDDKTFKVASTS